jgi:hypothetical protein
MFDIQFIIPVSTSGKYKQRLIDFIDYYGTYNVVDEKIKIYFLLGDEDPISYVEKPNVEIEFIQSEHNHPAVKIYDFIFKMTENDVMQAKWTAKIDDDAFNDIHNIVKVLNEYDYTEKNYIIPHPYIMESLDYPEPIIIKKLGLTEKIYPNIAHEVEGCWISQKALSFMKTDLDCMRLFKERTKHANGFTDQTLAVASRLIKLPIQKENRFYANQNDIKFPIINSSIFGGTICHFHPICADKQASVHQVIIAKIKNEKKPASLQFENRCYILRQYGRALHEIKLLEFGIVQNSQIYNRWVIDDDDKLVLDGWNNNICKFCMKELITNKRATDEKVSIYEI